MGRVQTGSHGHDHREDGPDPVVGQWIYVGTDGIDGVDDKLAANPHPYATGDTPGPPPFANGWTNAFLEDADFNAGDGLRYRWAAHGVQIDCGGGITGGADNTVITTVIVGSVPLPVTPKPGVDALLDGTGVFMYQLEANGDLVYLSAINSGIDGGSA